LNCLLVVLLAGWTMPAQADDSLVVIVNPGSGVTQLTRQEVARIYLGSQKFLAPGLVALPVEPLAPQSDRARFYHLLVNMSLLQVKTYWTEVFFTGQAQPPHQVRDSGEVVQFVATGRGGVGFIRPGQLTPRVRAVLTLASRP
jgi:ABC-type phosphate transport system substrate-binding protein